jgi:excinuclease ABC subunit A
MAKKNKAPQADHTGYENIEIFGAREHNLKNIDLSIPRNKLVVFTGISGSGKSSLAFDTIYAEGQRRYMESFSTYARSFIGNMERPDVDKINGLSPVISIEQKTTSKNPRSTVGTTTEIYDFMRLLFARAAEAYSYVTGNKMIKQSEDQIIEHLLKNNLNQKLYILAPVVKGRKGHYKELFAQIRKQGFTKVRIDGDISEIVPNMQVDRYKIHDIEIVIDRIVSDPNDRYRIAQSVNAALNQGKGIMMVLPFSEQDKSNTKAQFFSKYLMDPESGISYDEPAPNMFSFNSPYGACTTCNGLGIIEEITEESIIPDRSKSISRGAIVPLGEYRDIWIFRQLEAILKNYKKTLSTPLNEMPEELINIILHGSIETTEVKALSGNTYAYRFEGILNFLLKQQDSGSEKTLDWLADFMVTKVCPDCNGQRLKKESLHFLLDGKNISQLAQLSIAELLKWFENIETRLSERQVNIASEVLKEIRKRLRFLIDVGLDYLTLDRPLRTLSGGEAQRIRLATQIGTQLVGVLYILDEPSIGLHQRDNLKLINALKNLRDIGNSVIVVEHDKDMMLASDFIVDVGPGAGQNGGQVIALGKPSDFVKSNTSTAKYLKGELLFDKSKNRLGKNQEIMLKGASGNNLKNIDFVLPLGKLVCITGVSGSGKSTLIHDTLFPILNQYFFNSKRDPLPYTSITGLENIDKVIEVDQSPIGRTPRSNPATYTEVFSEIRTLFSMLPEAKIRGYKPGRFSFNVAGGRCEACEGAGMKLIEMEFLPDLYVPCEVCKGKRYNRETLDVRYKGKSISDVLDMNVSTALKFFESHPKILRKIEALEMVGLGYITLGQHANTLSGGEAQRIKLATELSKKDTGKTLYILDEPTTGLHYEDIRLLMKVLNQLVDKGNTVLIIEHNLDVIQMADYIVDIGPEGGKRGGTIVCQGSPSEVAKNEQSHTGKYLNLEMQQQQQQQ